MTAKEITEIFLKTRYDSPYDLLGLPHKKLINISTMSNIYELFRYFCRSARNLIFSSGVVNAASTALR